MIPWPLVNDPVLLQASGHFYYLSDMKYIILTILLIPVTLLASAQTHLDTARLSRTVRFADSAQTLIHTELINHGHIVGCFVQVFRATEMTTGKTLTALHFRDQNGYETFVDRDELPALQTALTQIVTKITATPPAAGTDQYYCFRSRTGFEAGCYVSKNTWQLYLALNAFNINTKWLLKPLDVEVFLDDLQDVIAKY